MIVLCGPNHEASGSAALRTGSSALPPSPVIFMARCRSLGPTQLQIAFRVRSGKKGVRGMCTCHEEAHLHSRCTAERNHHRWSPAPGPEAPATIATSCSQGWVSVWSGVSSGREFQAPRLGDGGWGGFPVLRARFNLSNTPLSRSPVVLQCWPRVSCKVEVKPE